MADTALQRVLICLPPASPSVHCLAPYRPYPRVGGAGQEEGRWPPVAGAWVPVKASWLPTGLSTSPLSRTRPPASVVLAADSSSNARRECHALAGTPCRDGPPLSSRRGARLDLTNAISPLPTPFSARPTRPPLAPRGHAPRPAASLPAAVSRPALGSFSFHFLCPLPQDSSDQAAGPHAPFKMKTAI